MEKQSLKKLKCNNHYIKICLKILLTKLIINNKKKNLKLSKMVL